MPFMELLRICVLSHIVWGTNGFLHEEDLPGWFSGILGACCSYCNSFQSP